MHRVYSKRRAYALLTLALLAFTSSVAAKDVPYFTDNGYGNPVATIQHPSGEHYNGTTYVAYQGPHEDPYVCAFHHGSETWTGPVKAGTSLMGLTVDALTRNGRVDNHGRPALVIDAAGYLHLVFGAHGGSPSFGENLLGAAGKGKMTHVVSKRPGDITEWEVLDNISPFGTYTQWVKMDDGDIYLFYRHGTHQSDWVYQKSTDNGRTFDREVSVLKCKPIADNPRDVEAWYAWFNNGKGDTITASYVYHPCNKAGRHTKDRFNTYYMMMNCADDTWQNASGDKLPAPVTKQDADAHTLIVNTGDERANHGTCHVDEEGNPHVFFRQDNGEVRYYRWLGTQWQKPVRVVQTSSSQDGDMIVESPMKVKLLLRYKEAGKNVVGYWATADGGLTWNKQKPIVSSSQVSYNPISALVRNAHPDARLLVSSEPNGQKHQYRRILLLGDHGPVTRPAAEANNLGDRVAQMKTLAAKQPADAGRDGPRGRRVPGGRGPGGRGAPGQRGGQGGSGQPGANGSTP